jgi:Putative beta-barrel porin-2, OmpL-like. bbp2
MSARGSALLCLHGGIVLAGVMLALPLCLQAQSSDPAGAPTVTSTENRSWWRGVTVDGYLSFSYTYNTNDPIPEKNQFRVFDFNDNNPQLDAAQVVVQRPVSETGQFGFRVNAIAGAGVPEVTASYGLFRNNESGEGREYDLSEFYVSYIVPVAKGIRLDAGKFATYLGYEVIGGYDGYNEEFSRDFIFGYGLPFTQTGLRVSYAFSSRVSGVLSLTNGWDAVRNLNGGVTVGGQVAVVTSKSTNLTFSILHGPQKPHNDHDQSSLYDLVGTWKALPGLSLAIEGLYGDQDHAASDGSDAIWRGLAGYAKYGFTKRFSIAFRGEVFTDPSGTRTGTAQTLEGFTVTPEYVMAPKISRVKPELKRFDGTVVLRAEFRKDFSDVNSFRKGTGFIDRQFTNAVNLIYFF